MILKTTHASRADNTQGANWNFVEARHRAEGAKLSVNTSSSAARSTKNKYTEERRRCCSFSRVMENTSKKLGATLYFINVQIKKLPSHTSGENTFRSARKGVRVRGRVLSTLAVWRKAKANQTQTCRHLSCYLIKYRVNENSSVVIVMVILFLVGKGFRVVKVFQLFS